MSLVGKLNRYKCTKCRKFIITIDKEEGTTPFMIMCFATEGCDGFMQSSFYSGIGEFAKATYEWRKPTKEEYEKADLPMKQHFDMGGLDIYKI